MNEGEIRLVGGDNSSGRVEICLDGGWGTVCDDGWGRNDARVVCRQLGLPTFSEYEIVSIMTMHYILIIADSSAVSYASFGPGVEPILLYEVYCHGNELKLLSCYNYYGMSCSHFEVAGVNCPSGIVCVLSLIYV